MWDELDFWRRLAGLLIEAGGGKVTFGSENLYVGPHLDELVIDRQDNHMDRTTTIRVYRRPQTGPARVIHWEIMGKQLLSRVQAREDSELYGMLGIKRPDERLQLPPKKEEEKG
jgi:hypothetical protein